MSIFPDPRVVADRLLDALVPLIHAAYWSGVKDGALAAAVALLILLALIRR